MQQKARSMRTFIFKQGSYRINEQCFQNISRTIPDLWQILEKHCRQRPDFKTSLTPLKAQNNTEPLVKGMYESALLCGVGPMAGVAGAIAEEAARRSNCGGKEILIDNGGDLYMHLHSDLILGLYAGSSRISGKVAILIHPENTPLAVCSSSGTMGHSYSEGTCDLATVFAKNGALADCAATAAANLVKTEADLQSAAERIAAIQGISGLLLIKNEKIAIAGHPPELIKSDPSQTEFSINMHPDWN